MTTSAPSEAPAPPADMTYDDVVVLVRWMASGWPGFDVDEIAYAVEKPHGWANELPMIRAANAHAAASPGHSPGMTYDDTWSCAGSGGAECDWPRGERPEPA